MGILVALPIAAAIAVLGKRRIEEFVFLAIGIIISLIFVSGYTGNTRPGVYAAVVLAIVSVLYCGFVFIKDRTRFKDCVLTPGFFGGLLCIGFVWISLLGKTDIGSESDLCRVYAPQIINMYRYSNLGIGPASNNYMLLYNAPLCPAWCYFCNLLWFKYSDNINLVARMIFVVSALFPFYTFVNKGEKKKNIIVTGLIFLLPNIVWMPAYTYMNDVLLGSTAVYGTVMTIKLFTDKNRYNDITYLLAACWGIISTCLIKRAGALFLFGMVAVAVVYTMERLKDREYSAGIFKKLLPLRGMFAAVLTTIPFSVYRSIYYMSDKLFLLFPLLLFFFYIGLGLFSGLLKKMLMKKYFVSAFLLTAAVELSAVVAVLWAGAREVEVSGQEKEVFYTVIGEWFNEITVGKSLIIPDPMYLLIIVLVLIVLMIGISRGRIKSEHSENDIYNMFMPLFLSEFFVVLAFCYIYMGNLDEALSAVHTSRYIKPGVMVITAMLMYVLFSIKSTDRIKNMLVVLAILILLFPYNFITTIISDSPVRWDMYDEMYQSADVELTDQDRVIYIGRDWYVYYAAFPASVEWDVDVYKEETEPEEWEEKIAAGQYNYLILEDYQYTFPEKYGELFENGINSVKRYAIYDVVVENGTARFVFRGKMKTETE